MPWFDKHKWSRRRVERERKALAASVEELTSQEKPLEGEWSEEEEDDLAVTGGPTLIPPKLRLQSRSFPAVRIEVTKHVPLKRAVAREDAGWEAAASAVTPGKRLGRSTKVRLQAVHPGQVQEPTTERVPIVEAPEPRESDRHDGQAIVRRLEPREAANEPTREQNGQAIVRRVEPLAADISSPSLLCGSGVIEAGQEEAVIHNSRISEQSVVTVMLEGNPGPVVVHYISLQPRTGFTLHMSAPVTATTPFRYAAWLS